MKYEKTTTVNRGSFNISESTRVCPGTGRRQLQRLNHVLGETANTASQVMAYSKEVSDPSQSLSNGAQRSAKAAHETTALIEGAVTKAETGHPSPTTPPKPWMTLLIALAK